MSPTIARTTVVAANFPIILAVFGSVGAPLMMLVATATATATAILLLAKRAADAGARPTIDLRPPGPSQR